MSPNNVAYVLTKDDPSNTSLIDSKTSKLAYMVTTEITKGHIITEIRNAAEQSIATLEWRDTLPDRVSYKAEKTQSVNNWLKPKALLGPSESEVEFKDEQGRKFKWKAMQPTQSEDGQIVMELYAVDSPQSPIATFQRSEEHSPAKMLLTPEAQELDDLCITTLLFQEKKRRRNLEKKRRKIRPSQSDGGVVSAALNALGNASITI
ncbi:hypothetical protein M422DRAFT_266820 [Sphaerobolus stellatus SS14]|uniref:DUF6593 domain-containing protein n=1 Tax=Sphaerobolus stellatus (strain SS14) TaxID=990650 RepID=A0A0C9UA89_SPHS4|nr:hypothetical protein M422DRAFT_266820 [Sphaerobolus stellatus SS14]